MGACPNEPVATLTYTYRDATAVLGPLAAVADPHGYDLCARHAEQVVPPRGWEVIRLAPQMQPLGPSGDELAALAQSVRERGRLAPGGYPDSVAVSGSRHGHLRLVPKT
ncbi:MAG: DUF3499 domain-containing protein [Bifidobacteriaceae bacterium]|jgi:hypothetical protein|nr:DUF3499 domain-containing protein [Bifidobacteriaceae bacterium]